MAPRPLLSGSDTPFSPDGVAAVAADDRRARSQRLSRSSSARPKFRSCVDEEGEFVGFPGSRKYGAHRGCSGEVLVSRFKQLLGQCRIVGGE